MTDINILEKLEQILESDAKNYFESSERLSLMNILTKLRSKNPELNINELSTINKIFKKYSEL
jgi:hypothetical protein